jgi:glucoamylase
VANHYNPPAGQPPYVPSTLEIWNFDRQFPFMQAGKTIRIPLATKFSVRWTNDNWITWQDTTATSTSVGIYFADLPTTPGQAGSSLSFTFLWLPAGQWQGPPNFSVGLT